MPFSGERAATDLADWVRGVPILGLLIDNVLLAAIFITAVAVIVIMGTYWYQPVSSGGWRTRLRVAIYTFLAVFALLFIQHQGVIAKQSEIVRGGRAMHTFVGALEGKPRYRSEDLGGLIVTTGGRGDASDSESDSDSDSGSDSESSDSDDRSVSGGHRRHGDPVAPSASAVTMPLVRQPPDVLQRPLPAAMAAPAMAAPAPMVAGGMLGVPPAAAVDWRTGVNPLPVVPQYAI